MKYGVVAFGALALVAMMLVSFAPPASAAERIDPRITDAMMSIPGGVVINPHQAIWPEIGMELVTEYAVIAGVGPIGTCASNTICAYDGIALTGAKLSWSICGTYSVPAGFTTRSIADTHSTGSLQARNGAVTVATAIAGSWTNVYGTTTNVHCLL